ncbi:hypothetical protein [Reichenbachiella sp.]|uniref:hypothetical protein n=1 Tax=Reichenbachiella sp. TaxID=2184521 RepID=UPI003297908C
MRPNLALLLVCFLVTTELYGQTQFLVITNKKTNVTRKIKEGKVVFVHDIQGPFSKGKLEILNDSTIKVNQIHFALANISRVKRKTTLSKVVGGIFVTVGTIFFIHAASGQAKGYIDLTGAFNFLGTVSSSVGVTALVVGGRYHKKKWRYSIESK